MSVLYEIILRNVAARAGMLRGEQVVSRETSYITTPLTKAEIGEGPYPFTQLKDSVLQAEEALVTAIANNVNHPWRTFIDGTTAALSSGDALPSVDSAAKPIVGAWGAVRDGTATTIECTKQPPEVVRRRNAISSYYKVPVYYFFMLGARIYHTRTTVIIECCVYDRATQSTALDANAAMLLPDALEQAMMCGALSFLGVEPKLYAEYFNQTLTAIAGAASVSETMAQKVAV